MLVVGIAPVQLSKFTLLIGVHYIVYTTMYIFFYTCPHNKLYISTVITHAIIRSAHI